MPISADGRTPDTAVLQRRSGAAQVLQRCCKSQASVAGCIYILAQPRRCSSCSVVLLKTYKLYWFAAVIQQSHGLIQRRSGAVFAPRHECTACSLHCSANVQRQHHRDAAKVRHLASSMTGEQLLSASLKLEPTSYRGRKKLTNVSNFGHMGSKKTKVGQPGPPKTTPKNNP